jgi:hypothetical protein
MQKGARGFRLMKQQQNGTFAVYLFKVNGSKYLVSIHYLFFKMMYKKKNHEFLNEEDAMRYFDKISHRLAS